MRADRTKRRPAISRREGRTLVSARVSWAGGEACSGAVRGCRAFSEGSPAVAFSQAEHVAHCAPARLPTAPLLFPSVFRRFFRAALTKQPRTTSPRPGARPPPTGRPAPPRRGPKGPLAHIARLVCHSSSLGLRFRPALRGQSRPGARPMRPRLGLARTRFRPCRRSHHQPRAARGPRRLAGRLHHPPWTLVGLLPRPSPVVIHTRIHHSPRARRLGRGRGAGLSCPVDGCGTRVIVPRPLGATAKTKAAPWGGSVRCYQVGGVDAFLQSKGSRPDSVGAFILKRRWAACRLVRS